MAVRRELVFDECVGASRLRRQAHVFLIDRLTTHQEKRKRKRGENGLCADPLAKSRFYRRALLSYFLFPFASSFFLFRRGYCCTVPRASQRPQNRRLKFAQTFVCCFYEDFHYTYAFRPLQSRLKPSEHNDFGFLPLTCAN